MIKRSQVLKLGFNGSWALIGLERDKGCPFKGLVLDSLENPGRENSVEDERPTTMGLSSFRNQGILKRE